MLGFSGYLRVGDLYALNELRENLGTQPAGVQQTFYTFHGALVFQPIILESGFNEYFFPQPETNYLNSAVAMCPWSEVVTEVLPFARAILRFIRRRSGGIRGAAALVSRTLTALLRLQVSYVFCIAVRQQATFVIHGFHPPALSEASI